MLQNDAHKHGFFLAAFSAKKINKQAARAEGAREKKFGVLRLRVRVFGIILAKMLQNDAHKNCLFLAAPRVEKDQKPARARLRRARENLAFLRLRVRVLASI